MPGAHPAGREASYLDRPEGGEDVTLQLAHVQLAGPQTQVRPLLQPTPGKLGQRHLAGERVDPDASTEVGWHPGEVAGGGAPGLEGARSDVLPRRRPGTEPGSDRWQLSNTPPVGPSPSQCRRVPRASRYGTIWHAGARGNPPIRPKEAKMASDQAFCESGRRESNSRSQLGKLMFCL